MLTDKRIREIWAQATGDSAPVYIVEQALDSFARAVEREARREALEEAARVCDEASIKWPVAGVARECAAAVRALIEKEPRT